MSSESQPPSATHADSEPLELPPPRPTTVFSELGLAGPSSLPRPETSNATIPSTSRLPTKHMRSQTEGHPPSRGLGKFSKLLGTVLTSPFSSSSSMQRSRFAEPHSRMTSPTPSVEYSIISVPTVSDAPQRHSVPFTPGPKISTSENLAMLSSHSMFFQPSSSKKASHSAPMSSSTSSPSKLSGKRILPRLWTALSSPTKEAGVRFRRKGKGKVTDNIPFGDYHFPLDGEEGELIDDEACFVDTPIGIDIISRLPPEITVYLLLFLDLHSIVVCLAVSRNWRRLASDPLVWRTLFHATPGWEINTELAQKQLTAAANSITRNGRTNSIISVANSFRNDIDSTLGRVRRLQSPSSTPSPSQNHQPQLSASPTASILASHNRQSVSSMSTSVEMTLSSSCLISPPNPERVFAPLALDWQALYKTRFEIERRVCGISSTVLGTNCQSSAGIEPRMTKLSGHLDSVYCLEFDAYKIVTGSRDKTIKVWSLRTGKLRSTLHGHDGSVLCLKFDASGFMVSGSSDRRILVWDLGKGEVRKVLTGHHGGVLDLRVDKQWIVSCSKDAVIRVWDRTTLKPHCSLHGHDGPVNAVGLQDGKIVSASGDGRMILWDIATASRIRTFDGHDRGLACIEFKDDYICSGSNDWKIKVWSATTGECLRTLSGHAALVRALSFNPRTGRLVSGSYDRTVKMWDIRSGAMIREFRNAHDSHIFDVKFDASHIVSTSHDQKIVVLDWSYGLDATLLL